MVAKSSLSLSAAEPDFAKPILSVRNIRSTAKMVKQTYSYYGEPLGSPIQPHMTTLSPKLGVGNPQSKLASQIVAKWYQIQWWFVLTADGNLYQLPTQQYHRRPPRGTPSPKIRGDQKIELNMAEKP